MKEVSEGEFRPGVSRYSPVFTKKGLGLRVGLRKHRQGCSGSGLGLEKGWG